MEIAVLPPRQRRMQYPPAVVINATQRHLEIREPLKVGAGGAAFADAPLNGKYGGAGDGSVAQVHEVAAAHQQQRCAGAGTGA